MKYNFFYFIVFFLFVSGLTIPLSELNNLLIKNEKKYDALNITLDECVVNDSQIKSIFSETINEINIKHNNNLLLILSFDIISNLLMFFFMLKKG